MKIEYIGHSCFCFTASNGVKIVTDPYRDIGIQMPFLEADIVAISHGHYDHNSIDAVSAKYVLTEPSDFEFQDVKIKFIECFHDEVNGAKRGKNHVILFEMDGISVCHMGDIGEPCSRELLKKLPQIDVLCIPVGGVYTIDANGAKLYVDNIQPKMVIPMHYFGEGLTIDIAPPDKFLDFFPKNTVEINEKNTIMLDVNCLKASNIKIIKLRRFQDV